MNSIDLKGQVAVVTGGAQGIGYAIAERLAASGAKIASFDRDVELNAGAMEKLGQGALAVACDVTDWDSIEAARTEAEKALGPASILVNSAGIAGPTVPLDVYDIDIWRQVIDVNLNGTFLINRAFVPGMKARGYGRIVNIASIAGKEGNPNAAPYSASKAGVIAITKSLGKELASFDIAVNCITPAAAKTRIFEQISQHHIDYMLSKIPRNRFVHVDEIAAMVAWLVSKENSFTTAGVFDLSGGRATY